MAETRYERLSSDQGFSLLTGYFFVLNATVGAGFLALPKIFAISGWAFSSLFMIYAAFQGLYLARILTQTMSRVTAIEELRSDGVDIPIPSIWDVIKGTVHPVQSEKEPQISDRRVDACYMSYVLLGHNVSYIYTFILVVQMLGTMAMYQTIFASSLAATIPLPYLPVCEIAYTSSYADACFKNYWIFLVIFSAVTTYLVVEGLKEQQWLQITLSIGRFVTIFLVVAASIGLIVTGTESDSDESREIQMPVAVNMTQIGLSSSSIVFAFAFQLQTTSISRYVRQPARNLPKIPTFISGTCFALYLMLGIIVPLAFTEVETMITLNFEDYSAGFSQSERPWWTYAVSYFLLLFPAADVISAFPLFGISVSDNIIGILLGPGHNNQISIIKQNIIKIIVCVIPFLVTFFVVDLVKYTQKKLLSWSGLAGFVVLPIAVPIMHMCSRQLLPQRGLYDATFAKNVMAIQWISWLIVFISCVFMVIFAVDLALGKI